MQSGYRRLKSGRKLRIAINATQRPNEIRGQKSVE